MCYLPLKHETVKKKKKKKNQLNLGLFTKNSLLKPNLAKYNLSKLKSFSFNFMHP